MSARRPAVMLGCVAVAFTAFSAVRGERRVIAYLVVVGLLSWGALVVHRRVRFSDRMCWALAGCGVAHFIGGMLPSPTDGADVFYETWLVPEVLKYDQLAHLGVSAVVAAAMWHVLGTVLHHDTSPRVRALLAALLALGVGAGNEMFEFLAGLRFADAYIGGLANTGWDLMFNGAGAASTAVYLAARNRLPPTSARLRPLTTRNSEDLGAEARNRSRA